MKLISNSFPYDEESVMNLGAAAILSTFLFGILGTGISMYFILSNYVPRGKVMLLLSINIAAMGTIISYVFLR